MKNIITFSIGLPTDKGFLGHACNAPKCKQYFKVHSDDRTQKMHCPYCSEPFEQDKLRTTEQTEHIRKTTEAEVMFHAQQELQKMLKGVFGKPASSRNSVSFSYKPSPIIKKKPSIRYSERKLDTELKCPVCECRFQIYGIFGYCPRCTETNIAIYDTNWALIQREVATAENPKRALRHAYGDLVSSFESFCASKARQLSPPTVSFQVLFDARKYFKEQIGIDILADIAPPALLSLRRVFQKRHACIHAGGKITERYVRMIPEDKERLGQEVELTLEEMAEGAAAMRLTLATLIKAIEEPGKKN